MDTTKTVVASFGSQRRTVTRYLYQYDYGQTLQFAGLELPQAYEVHFSRHEVNGGSITQIGDENGVAIPDEMLLVGQKFYAWVYLHAGLADGETRYLVEIPVKARPEITNQEPTPVQQDAITEAIAALNRAVEQTAGDVEAAAESAQESERQANLSAESAQASAASAAASEASRQGAATQAGNAAQSAAQAASSAAASAQSAAQSAASASASEASAEDAEQSADRAEQAAAEAGWLFFEIVGGDLWLERTPNVSTDFYLQDGDLWMEATT